MSKTVRYEFKAGESCGTATETVVEQIPYPKLKTFLVADPGVKMSDGTMVSVADFIKTIEHIELGVITDSKCPQDSKTLLVIEFLKKKCNVQTISELDENLMMRETTSEPNGGSDSDDGCLNYRITTNWAETARYLNAPDYEITEVNYPNILSTLSYKIDTEAMYISYIDLQGEATSMIILFEECHPQSSDELIEIIMREVEKEIPKKLFTIHKSDNGWYLDNVDSHPISIMLHPHFSKLIFGSTSRLETKIIDDIKFKELTLKPSESYGPFTPDYNLKSLLLLQIDHHQMIVPSQAKYLERVQHVTSQRFPLRCQPKEVSLMVSYGSIRPLIEPIPFPIDSYIELVMTPIDKK